ncbi:MAG: hypothetical protein LBH90_00615 [Tannerella sp.]|nr:hypothetical protein [Tannerella sp.]
MDKVTEFLKENPHTLGLIFALFGVVMLIAAITGAKWLFKKDVSGVTYSLEKIDGRDQYVRRENRAYRCGNKCRIYHFRRYVLVFGEYYYKSKQTVNDTASQIYV